MHVVVSAPGPIIRRDPRACLDRKKCADPVNFDNFAPFQSVDPVNFDNFASR